MAHLPPIQILLASYNGERYLREQIESILEQTYENLSVLARDDGSSDATSSILEEYAVRLPHRFAILPTGTPSGSPKDNFSLLLAASTAPYVALSDQDDVWIPEKIALSLEAMRRLERSHPPATPLLVFTDLQVADSTLRELHPSFWAQQNIDPRIIHKVPRMLMQNVVTGCTMLFNRALAELAVPTPPEAYMHDWWIALIASALGAAAFIQQPTVRYRQHESNVLGAPDRGRVTGIPKWRQHEKRRAQWEMSVRQTAALLDLLRPLLRPEQIRLLEDFAQCANSPSRVVRSWTYVRNRFFVKDVRTSLAILWYLWDMQAAKRHG